MCNKLISSLVGTAFVVAVSRLAFAADMAVKAPPPPPPAPVYSWTGWYVGGNVGYSWGSASNDFAFSQSSQLGGGPPFWTFNGSEREQLDGVIGGGQAGYNWQVGTFLYGLETDIQGSAEKHTGSFSGILLQPPTLQFSVGNNPVTVTETDQIDWFGTVRGRVGLTSDHWLFYATGGLAYGHVSSSGSLQPGISGGFLVPPNQPIPWSNSETKVGWTIGGGIEYAIFGNWSWRVEYLYMDLGKLTTTASGGVGNCYGAVGVGCAGVFVPGTLPVTSHFTDNIVRVGLNYQFH
jgi:outer membrane immunogenic protein